ncbi:MAG: right-handed parallel beta-helix repeat-containing protein [Iphinoe sp. HA4291-MV1]|jgi:hypothetical protein|nr:right-handed parallel beta-helix repeat-containing protein [Iphinoe sp. HA4291-MV1]
MSTITVTSNADNGAGSLREAIAKAQSGDTIQFASNLANQTITLTSGQLTVNKSLTIDGAGTTGLTISGNNSSRIFDVTGYGSSFSLRNLTLINGKSSGGGEAGAGGAIRTPSTDRLTTLNVENCTFKNNTSSGDGGGAIWAGYYTASTITNSVFDSNDGTSGTGERGGGAISTNSKSTLTVKNSEFTNNKGTNGGAINSLLTQLTVEGSTFRNNDSTAGGHLNHASGHGGAIYTDGANEDGPNVSSKTVGGTITIRNSWFEGNKAAGQGGGLSLFAYPPDKVVIENSTITKNEAIRDVTGYGLGGGIRIGNVAQFTINNTTVTDNRALDQGGGLWLGEKSPGTISNSKFTGNRAETPDGKGGLGGGITLANGSSPVTIDGTTVANNYAGWQGGGISGGGSSTTVKNSSFANNVAYNGGNGWNIRNQVTNQLSDGGGNTQWPNKTSSTDINVTASVAIVQPTSSSLQTATQSAGNDISGNGSSSGTENNLAPASVTDNTSNNGTSVDTTGNTSSNSTNNSLTAEPLSANSSNSGSDDNQSQVSTSDNGSSSSTPEVTIGNDCLLCGNITSDDSLYSGLSQQTLTEGGGTNNFTLTPGQSSELIPTSNSGQNYVSLLYNTNPSQQSSSQPGQDSWNVNNPQRQSLATLENVNTSTLVSNSQSVSGL